jgi:tetratricopeptide (TPR) repeat protein
LKTANPNGTRKAGIPQALPVGCVCVFLALAVLAVFGQTAHFGFVNLDDDLYVYENGKVASGLTLQGVTWLFTHAECHFYHPLTMLSLMLDYQLHGLDAGGYHLTNVLIHAASAILLFLILRRMTGALWRSAFVAAVFAIHPLRVESVAWVSERKDVLATFFFMLTLGAYVRYARDPNSLGRYLTVAGLFGLGLLCKPTAVTLPFVLLLLDYWPLQRLAPQAPTGAFVIPKRLILEKIPLVALAGVACVMTYYAEAEGNSVVPIANISVPLRMGNVLVSYVIYLRQMVWPTGLAVFYPYPEKNHPFWEIGLAFLLLAVISGAVLAVWRKRPWLMAGWFWYLGMLVPAIGIVQVGVFAHADRNTYLPQIGLYVLAAWAAADWSAGWKHRRVVWGSLMVAMIGALLVCGRKQTSYWRDSETLWRRALACTAANNFACVDLGDALLSRGAVDDAIEQYQKAVEIKPEEPGSRIDLGVALLKKGKLEEAIAQFRRVLELNPAYEKVHYNLGIALFQKGNLAEAIAQYRTALELKPDDEAAIRNLGDALLKQGDLDESIAQYRKALDSHANDVEAHYSLGNVLLLKGNVEEAIGEYRKVIEFNPAYEDAHYNLGIALFQKGNLEGAIAQYRTALELKPDDENAHKNLGDALLKQGKLDEAAAQYRKALDIHSDDLEAHYSLGKALLRKGDLDGAMACFQKSAEPSPDPLTRWNRLGDALLQKGDLEEAMVCYQQAIKINPRSAEAYANLGLAFFKKAEIKQAMDSWQQALEI